MNLSEEVAEEVCLLVRDRVFDRVFNQVHGQTNWRSREDTHDKIWTPERSGIVSRVTEQILKQVKVPW